MPHLKSVAVNASGENVHVSTTGPNGMTTVALPFLSAKRLLTILEEEVRKAERVRIERVGLCPQCRGDFGGCSRCEGTGWIK